MSSPKSATQIAAGKRELSITSMYFNRYLIFRYLTALFFFTNLYWLIILAGTHSWGWLLPSGLLVGSVAVMAEQGGKYWHHTNRLKITRSYYVIQAIINFGLLVTVAFGQMKPFYSFVSQTGRLELMGLLAVGILLSGLLEYRAHLIEHDQDRYLQHIKQFEASL